MGLDIGPNTVNIFKNNLSNAKTIMWNGPLGVYEFKNYVKGTNDVLTYLTEIDAKTVLGGGDIVAAASSCNVTDKLYHISTGGGATPRIFRRERFTRLKKYRRKINYTKGGSIMHGNEYRFIYRCLCTFC